MRSLDRLHNLLRIKKHWRAIFTTYRIRLKYDPHIRVNCMDYERI